MRFLSSLFGDRTLIFLGVLVALVLLAAFVATLTRLFGDRSGRALGGRTRQQRLGVVDAFDLDRQRQLVIVRRDNVEHLLMIGGPNDIVVESAIVRQATASAPLGQRESYGPSLASARQSAGGLDGRPEFETPAQEPTLPAGPGYAPAHGPTPAPVPTPPPPAAGPRFPFPPQPQRPPSPPPAAAQRAPIREVPRLSQQPQPQSPAPPSREPVAAAPPPPAPEPAPAEPLAAAVTPQPSERTVPPPPSVAVPGPRPGPSPRPARPFPTLRPGGGPLFPIRSATSPNKPADDAGKTPPAPAADGAPQKSAVIESFESLEEEMARLLGRPSSGDR